MNIIDAKIDGDVTIMSPDEFAKKLEESKRQYIVNIDDNLKVLDVDTMVINKKIQDASKCLEDGNFEMVKDLLKGLPKNILSVERLKFLAEFKVKNEFELSLHNGYIDTMTYEEYAKEFTREYDYDKEVGYVRFGCREDNEKFIMNPHYKLILKLADEQTKETYIKLANYCRERYDIKTKIEKEIIEVEKLLKVQLYQEAIAYSKAMCQKYPQTAKSWMYALEVKIAMDNNYNCEFEYEMMGKCSDFAEYNRGARFQQRIDEFKAASEGYKLADYYYNKYMSKIVFWLYLTPIVTPLASFPVAFSIYEENSSDLKEKEFKRKKNLYESKINTIPSKIKEIYEFKPSIKRTFLKLTLRIWFILFAVILITIMYLCSHG